MDQRLTLITLGVSNLQTSIDFYEKKFGWQRTAASNGDIVFFQLNGIQLALFPRESLAEDAHVASGGTGFRGFTLAYNTRSEAEVDAVVNHLRGQGVTVVKEPQKVFWGGYSSYVSDPDGNLWEIAYNPYLPMDEKGNVIGQ
ncbi:MAG TPA: VOC family protein [Chitinophagaceae bacterium]